MRASITTVGIVTRDRSASLERVLPGYVENDRRFGRRSAFVVADGSEGAQARDAGRKTLRLARERWGGEVSYAGLEEKTSFARSLTGAGLPREIVRFALFGSRTPGSRVGANRNALLLHAAGELVFNSDDDVRCRVAPAPGRRKGTAHGGGFNAEEFWFFNTEAAALRSVRFERRDILALHEEFLGREIPGRGRVLVTTNGLVGDCALESPRPYLRLGGGSRRRLTATKSGYGRALSRQVVRCVARATASPGAGVVTASVGFDNRRVLAPFMPMFRNEDGLFGLMMQRCFSEGLLVQLPWVLHHAPPRPRTFRPEELRLAVPGFRVNDVLQLIVAALPPVSGDGALRALGSRLEEFASASPSEFRGSAAVLLRRARLLQTMHYERLLREHRGAPKYWAEDVRALKDDLERSLGFEPPPPAELSSRRGRAAGWEAFRRLVLEFAALTKAWPELVAAAKDLRGRGVRLALSPDA